MGYIVLAMNNSEKWAIYRRGDGRRVLVASSLPKQSADVIARKACNEPMFDRTAVLRCGGVWH